MGEEAGFTVTRLAVVLVVAIAADRLLGLSPVRAWAVLAVAMVWSLTPAARLRTAVAAVVVTWLLGTGFLSNQLGELSFGPADRQHLAVAGGGAVVALVISRRAASVVRTRRVGTS